MPERLIDRWLPRLLTLGLTLSAPAPGRAQTDPTASMPPPPAPAAAQSMTAQQEAFAQKRLAIGTAPAQTAPGIPRLPVELFASRPELSQPHLSPDGHYLSVVMEDQQNGEHDLAIYDISAATPRLSSVLKMPHHQVPLNMVWSSPTQLVIEKGQTDGSLDRPAYMGEIITTDILGRHGRYLYGYARDRARYVGASSQQADRGWGWVVDVRHPGDGHFTMAVTEWDRRGHTDLYDVNSLDGHRRLLGGVDIDQAHFITDDQGRPVLGYGQDEHNRYRVYSWQTDHWQLLPQKQTGGLIEPLGLSPDAGRIYTLHSTGGRPLALVEQALDGGGRKVLAHHPYVDIGQIEWTARPRRPFAETLAGGKPYPYYLQPDLPEAQLYRQLTKLYPGLYVHFIDFSEDGKQLLFSLASDRQPPVYLLLNTETGKTHLLFSSQPKVDSAQMAERRSRAFMVSDGTVVEAILTLPADYRQHPLAAVLMPHGGPFGISDHWYYDADAQFLANRGYLVVQVNFRSSGGHSPAFINAGERHWGDRVQQDMIDVMRQLVAEGSVDAHRICTYGASFGGYSALMSVARAPGLFRCAIGYAGVYDLPMMYSKGDIQETSLGRSYLHQAIGDDPAVLAANSPDRLATVINVPVLLIHGKDDQRAPFAQAKAMRDALEAAGHAPQWMAVPDEGHGFYIPANNIRRLQLIEQFLAAHIGTAHSTPATDQ
ncbi:alpha/beta hydrolase family protein [Frateuria aurantia]